jgi:hypothetical protein
LENQHLFPRHDAGSVLEHLMPFLSKFGNFAEAHRHLVEEIVWPHFWLIQMWLIVLFFVYCSLRELI